MRKTTTCPKCRCDVLHSHCIHCDYKGNGKQTIRFSPSEEVTLDSIVAPVLVAAAIDGSLPSDMNECTSYWFEDKYNEYFGVDIDSPS